MTLEPKELESQGKTAYMGKRFAHAAELFRQAAEGYTLGRNGLMAAEMMNNVSVALLQAGKARESLEAALGTDEVFAGAKDIKRQAMAIGNQAAALDALKQYDDALEKYKQAAELFEQINEGDLRAVVLKSIANIKLKSGKVSDSAFEMLDSLGAKKTPTLLERFLKFLLKLFSPK